MSSPKKQFRNKIKTIISNRPEQIEEMVSTIHVKVVNVDELYFKPYKKVLTQKTGVVNIHIPGDESITDFFF